MRTRTAGPRLRCFLGFVAPAFFFLIGSATAMAQAAPAAVPSACPDVRGIAVPQIRGEVYDAFGIAVPFATLTVLGIHGEVQTMADKTGYFSFDVPSGYYVLKAEGEGFAYSSAELKVGRSWRTLFGHQKLKVMLGFAETYCPWVTTDNKKFQDTAEANMKRLKESAQIMDPAAPGNESSHTNAPPETAERSPTGDTPQPEATLHTKETSQTHATQK